jgi:hypothetical protein
LSRDNQTGFFVLGFIEAGLRSPLRYPASTIGCLATTKPIFVLGFIEAGLRSPLRYPASTIGRLATTKLIFCSRFYRGRVALSPSQPGLNYRLSHDNQTKSLFLGLIEAGSRSPLHNPASTHGRPTTTELKLFS